MRRIVVLFVVGSVTALAAPAFAQTAPNASVTAPGDGEIVEGTVTARGRGTATAGVRSIKMFIEGALVASKEPSELRQEVDVDYSWNTATVLGGSGIARNGWYQIKVTVVSNSGESTDSTRNVRVNNPAVAPSGLSVITHEQRVNLSWSPNPEPDIQAYRIEADGGSGFVSVGQSDTTNFSYEATPGTYNWRVVALRSSPADAGGRPSGPSATVAATVKAPPAAEETDGGGSAKGGGAVVGNKKIFGGATTTKEAAKSLRRTARRFASGGISSASISLPGAAIGLPSLPDTELAWGTYEEKLPYNLPATKGLTLETAPVRLAAHSTTHLMPLDALQWVAAGLLLMVTAGLLVFLAWRIEKDEKTA